MQSEWLTYLAETRPDLYAQAKVEVEWACKWRDDKIAALTTEGEKGEEVHGALIGVQRTVLNTAIEKSKAVTKDLIVLRDSFSTTEGDDVRCMDDTALETVDRMCARSLSPGVHDMWETVKYELARARTTEGEKGECVCTWEECKPSDIFVYRTSCGKALIADVTPFCPYCGKPISTTKPQGEV